MQIPQRFRNAPFFVCILHSFPTLWLCICPKEQNVASYLLISKKMYVIIGGINLYGGNEGLGRRHTMYEEEILI